jgi:hypothetical protein
MTGTEIVSLVAAGIAILASVASWYFAWLNKREQQEHERIMARIRALSAEKGKETGDK